MKKFLTSVLFIGIILFTCTSCKETDNNKKLPNEIDESFRRQEIIADEVAGCDTPKLTGDLSDYEIVWSDEFNYTGTPDSTKWSYEVGTGNGGWGNNESQNYTNRKDNAYVENGNLKITAKREAYAGSEFTSARLISKGKGDFKYGYIEMRAILPSGRGVWPAFWMMPTDSVYGGWPNSGEIDIMEYVGNRKDIILGTVHSAALHGGNGRGNSIRVTGVEENYHTYSLLWDDSWLYFYVDGNKYHQVQNGKLTNNNYKFWPYDQEFFIILNVAMGGNLGGNIGSEFMESSMVIDYVRVYQKNLKGIDTKRPSKVLIDNYTSSSSSISLNWQKASDDLGIKQYEVVVDGKQVAATTKNSCTINDLKPNQKYTIQILAVDHGGNFSVSKAISVKTNDVLKAPGKIEVEQFFSGVGASTIANPNGTQSVDFMVIHSENPYIICEVQVATAGEYSISCFLQGNRPSTVYIYSVDQNLEGDKGEGIKVSSTFGTYKTVEASYNITLTSGINYIKIECANASDGKTATIDYLTLNLK